MSDIHRLNIRRLQAEYIVAAQHPEPDGLKARLDETMARHLAQALPAVLAPQMAGADTSVWLIRSMQVEVAVNAAWEPERVARTWAGQLERVLAETLSGSPDGENTLWFPNRAAFLAQFLADVANSRAWGTWQYEAFDGLRLLPPSAALRTAICDQPAPGREALRQLSPADLAQVLRTLTGQDARRVLDHLNAAEPAGSAMRCWRAAWSAWQKLALDPAEAAAEARQALHLYLVAGQVDEQAGGPALRAAALTLPRLARRLARSSPGAATTLLALLAAGDLAGLYLHAGAETEWLSPLLNSPPGPEWVHEVGRALLARQAAVHPSPSAATPDHRQTTSGGLFLLLPLLDELPLEKATAGWPEAEPATPASLVRFLLLIKCGGQAAAIRLFYDPLARDLLNIPFNLTLAELAAWQRRVTASNRLTLLKTLGQWQQAKGALRGETYLMARVPARGAPLALLIEAERDLWLEVLSYQAQHRHRLLQMLQRWLELAAGEPRLIGDRRLLEVLPPEWQMSRTIGLPAGEAQAPADQRIEELLARLDKLPGDVAYLALPPPWGITPALDRTLSVAAQQLLRALAWRLPGFAFSSLPYLQANFLNFAASLAEEPDRRVVRLAKPPLHLLLNLTGMGRATYRLSWLDERPFLLWTE